MGCLSRCSLCYLAVAIFCLSLCTLDARSLQARMLPVDEQCENTREGRHYLSDSKGYVCGRMEMNYQSGCCATGIKHSCHTCLSRDRCCSSYEHCISCCMGPDNRADKLYLESFRVAGKNETGKWESPFQYCAGKCRTTINSTSHENSFIDSRHFCFSDTGRPKIVENPPEVPVGVEILAGLKGRDCHTTCQTGGLICNVAMMTTVNHCDALRAHFQCEAGCVESKGHSDAPSYAVFGTGKPLNPALCTYAASTESMSCSASAAHVRRICACTGVAGLSQLASETSEEVQTDGGPER